MLMKYDIDTDSVNECGIIFGQNENECMRNLFDHYGRNTIKSFTFSYIDGYSNDVYPEANILETIAEVFKLV